MWEEGEAGGDLVSEVVMGVVMGADGMMLVMEIRKRTSVNDVRLDLIPTLRT